MPPEEPTVSVPFGSLPYTYEMALVDKATGRPQDAWEPISAIEALKRVRDVHDEMGGPKALLRGDELRCGAVYVRAVRANGVETPTPVPELEDDPEIPQPSQAEDLESLTKEELKSLIDARGLSADRRSRTSMINALKESSDV